MSSKKMIFNVVLWFASSTMVEKAPVHKKRWDNGKFTFDLEASVGQVCGLGFAVEAKNALLSCGHPFRGVRVDLYLGPVNVGITLSSSYKAHEEFHDEQEDKEDEFPLTEEQLAEYDIQGLDELQKIADSMGVPIEQLADQLPEPLRTEILKRIDAKRIAETPAATEVLSDLERVRKGE
jgi:hypothetical protein